MTRSLVTSFVTLLSCAFLTGCSSSTETGSATVVRPTVGSTFTFHRSWSDSTGAVVDKYDFEVTVASTTMAVGGRTGVIKLIDASERDTSYEFIESNGDVSLYEELERDSSIWMRMPFSGAGGESITLIDTTGDLLDKGQTVRAVGSLSTVAMGSEAVVTEAGTFQARKAKLSAAIHVTGTDVDMWQTRDQIMWLAPSLGIVIETEIPSGKDLSDRTWQSKKEILSTYTLK